MKYATVAAVLAFAATASAQAACNSVAEKVPSCAVPCISSAASQQGCAETNYSCQCEASNSAAIQSHAQNCVLSACGAQTGIEVLSSAQAVCSCAATAGSGSGSSAPSSASATPTGAGSSSAAAGGSTYATSAATSAAGTGSATYTTGAGVSPSITPAKGGAATVVVGMGGIMGALLAAIAAL